MTNSKSLHAQSIDLRRKIQDKLHEADHTSARVEAYNKAGDLGRASTESNLAIRYYNEALKMEYDAMEIEAKAAELEGRAIVIDKQEISIQNRCREEIERLEGQKKALLG